MAEQNSEKNGERREKFLYFIFVLRRNPLFLFGLIVVLFLIVAAIIPSYITPYPDDASTGMHFDRKFNPPTLEHPFGTDRMGRDIFTRVVFGSRMSLKIGITVVTLSFILGVPFGLIAGFFGGKVDEIIMRISDIFLSFPTLLLPMAIAAALGPSLTNAMIAIGIAFFPGYARLIRSITISLKEELYVEAARSIGAGNTRIIIGHIFPNSVASIIVKASMDMGYAILIAAALSFIGLGARPPAIEWGLMITTAKITFLDYWWTVTFPGLAIFVSVLAFNFIGDGLRDIFDPKLKV